MMTPTIVIAEDHSMTRHGLKVLLSEALQARVQALCSSGREALDAVRAHRPDLLVLDLSMPGMTGMEVLHALPSTERTKTIVMSMHDDDAYVTQALRAGAKGYVLKGARTEEIIQAVQAVLGGDRYLSEDLSPMLAEVADAPEADEQVPETRYDLLTPREREVLNYVTDGHTSAAIADRLHISPRTVEKHRQNIMAKLDVSGVAALIQYGLEHARQFGGVTGEV